MRDSLLIFTEFSSTQLAFAVLCWFLAGVVRGFAGFVLSALIMASLVVILPPIQLLPICFTMELLAGLIVSRSGIGHGKMATVA